MARQKEQAGYETPLFHMLNKKGITYKQLGDRCKLADSRGCSPSFIHKISRGINLPSPELAEAIVKALAEMNVKKYGRKPISELMFFYPGRY